MPVPAKPKKIRINVREKTENPSPFVVNLREAASAPQEKIPAVFTAPHSAQEKIRAGLDRFFEALPDVREKISRTLERGWTAFEKKSPRRRGSAPLPAASVNLAARHPVRRRSADPAEKQKILLQKPILTPAHIQTLKSLTFKRLAEKAAHLPPRVIGEWGAIIAVSLLIFSVPLQALRAYAHAKTAQEKFTVNAQQVRADIDFLKRSLAQADMPAMRGSLGAMRDRVGKLENAANELWPFNLLPPLRNFRGLLRETDASIGRLDSIIATVQSAGEQPAAWADRMSILGQDIDALSSHLERIRTILPGLRMPFLGGENTVHSLQKVAASALTIAGYAKDVSAVLPLAAGQTAPKRYLLLFQNHHELRPTGGFIGSFAVVEMDKGAVVKWDLPGGGSYDLQGQFTAQLASPRPLWLVNPRFEFQDMNWFPDFPTSARKLADTYEKAAGGTVDGVVAITSRVMENLLAIIGPVEVPDSGKIVTAENFMELTQSAVELEYDKTANRPKEFLRELMDALSGKLASMSGEEKARVLMAALQGLATKDIQMFSRDGRVEEALGALDWTGALKDAPSDYLLLVSSNIGGGKTDGAIEQHIDKTTRIRADGTLSGTVRITLAHRGDPQNFWTRKRNVSFLRLYVPEGSTLVSASGFTAPPKYLFADPSGALTQDTDVRAAERSATTGPANTSIMRENHKTVFGNWIQIDPGQTKTFEFSYDLPRGTLRNGSDWEYSLLAQKQAGKDSSLSLTIEQETAAGTEILRQETVNLDTDRFLPFTLP